MNRQFRAGRDWTSVAPGGNEIDRPQAVHGGGVAQGMEGLGDRGVRHVFIAPDGNVQFQSPLNALLAGFYRVVGVEGEAFRPAHNLGPKGPQALGVESSAA